MLADLAYRSVDLSPVDPDFFPGHYYVGVYGWCTPDDQCPDPLTCGICSAAEDLPYKVTVTGVTIPLDTCTEWLDNRPKDDCVSGQHGVHTGSSAVSAFTAAMAIVVTVVCRW